MQKRGSIGRYMTYTSQWECPPPALDLRPKKKGCLVVLHRPPLICENWKKVFTVQKYTAPYFQNSKKGLFFFENFDLLKIIFKGGCANFTMCIFPFQ